MNYEKKRIFAPGYEITLPFFEGEGTLLINRYFSALSEKAEKLFKKCTGIPHTVCSCNFTVMSDETRLTVVVTARKRVRGVCTGKWKNTTVWDVSKLSPKRNAVIIKSKTEKKSI